MKLLLGRAVVVSFMLFGAGHGLARAHEPAPPGAAAARRNYWEVGLGAQLAYGIEGRRCVQDGDVVSCSNLGLIAFEFTPRYRLHDFSIGALAQLGKGDSVSLLHFGAEARWHALDSHDVDPWLGLDAGAAILIDSLPMTAERPPQSFTSVLPAFGASLGVDFALSEAVSLGIAARLLWLPTDRESYFSRAPTYDSQWLLSAGFAATYRFGF